MAPPPMVSPAARFGQVLLVTLAGFCVAVWGWHLLTVKIRRLRQRHPPLPLVQFAKLMLQFLLILLYVFICEGTTFITTKTPKTYSADIFLVVAVAILVLCVTTWRQNEPVFLSRHMTNEWKGVMQVLIIAYHYLAVKGVYSVIRICVTMYFWLTGWGNGVFFQREKADFSFHRISRLLFRLNFFTIGLMLVTGNSYLEYYFVPLTTLFLVLIIYPVHALWPAANRVHKKLMIKIGIAFAILFVLYEFEGVFRFFGRPIALLLGGPDPAFSVHELHFRTYLDHYSVLCGIVFAVVTAKAAQRLPHLEDSGGRFNVQRWLTTAWMAVVLCGAIVACFTLSKTDYNAVHPYLFMFPVMAFVFLRQCSPALRGGHSTAAAWLGERSLELYVGQFHIFLCNNAKAIVTVLPGYPMTNALLVGVLFVFICHRVFALSGEIRDVLFPKDRSVFPKRVAMSTLFLAFLALYAWQLQAFGAPTWLALVGGALMPVVAVPAANALLRVEMPWGRRAPLAVDPEDAQRGAELQPLDPGKVQVNISR